MPRVTYGPKVRARARCLLKMLLLFANGEVENSDRFDIKCCWLEDEKPIQLRIETNLRTLQALTRAQGEKLEKAQIREALKRMEGFLNILKDERVQKRGLEDWRFTLTLWSKDITENLQKFTQKWEEYHPLEQEKRLIDSVITLPKKLGAEYLDNLLQEQLDSLSLSEQKKLNSAISKSFILCDPAQDWIDGNRHNKLENLSQVSYPGWSQVDGLTQFAVFLATFYEYFTGDLFDQIKDFVESRQPDLNFESLLSQAIREKSDRNLSVDTQLEQLIIEVIPQEQSAGIRVSIWETANLSSPKVQDETMLLHELPNFIENWLEEESELTEPILHIFVPRDWLNLDISDCKTESELTLGSQYKLVMRTHLNLTPMGKQHYKRLQQKWQLLERKTQYTAKTTFVHADCSSPAKLFQALKPAEMAILENLDLSKLGKVLEFIARKTALPVALWSRRCELSHCINNILDCQVGQLPEQILQERFDSLTADDHHIGRHLTLVWEDPNIMPPSLQLDSEVC